MGLFWDDLNIPSSADIHYQTLGTAPNRQFVVQWTRASFLSSNDTELTFQLRLHEADGSFEYFYGPMLPGSAGNTRTTGSSATVGLQSQDKTQGIQCGYNKAGTVLPGSVQFFHH